MTTKHRALRRVARFVIELLIAVSLTLVAAKPLWAAPTKVGNGDDGNDLEGAVPVLSGPLWESRAAAVELLRRLNVAAVNGLGLLIPEVEKSTLLLARQDVRARYPSDRGMESAPNGGFVYARTFAEPHAATRFFPAALGLSQEQLIALHVHEALHRSLPEEVREGEDTVTQITIAITAPEASHDRIRRVAARYLEVLQPRPLTTQPIRDSRPSEASTIRARQDERESADRQTSVSYQYEQFQLGQETSQRTPVRALHSLGALFHPFDIRGHEVGLGFGFSYINAEDRSYLGPLQLQARVSLGEWQRTRFEALAKTSLTTAADGELRNSFFGRDVHTLGISARKESAKSYLQADLLYSLAGESETRFGNQSYTMRFGGITTGALHAGLKWKKISLGGLTELHFAESFRPQGGAFDDYSVGAYRILTAGPEVAWIEKDFQLSLFGRWVMSAPTDVNLDYMGDVMGRGAGQGTVGAALKLNL